MMDGIRTHLRGFLPMATVVLVLATGYGLLLLPSIQPTGDFLSYVAAGKALRQGVDMYRDADMARLWSEEFHLPFSNRYIYPPLLATAMSAVATIPRSDIFRAFTWINYASLLALAPLLGTVLARSGIRRPGLSAVVVLLALAYNLPAIRTLSFSQVNLLVLDLMLASLLLADRSSSMSAGLLCLAANIKMAPVLLVLPFILRRSWGWLSWFLIAQAIMLTVTIVPHGIEPWRSFLHYTMHNAGLPIGRSTSFDSLVYLWAQRAGAPSGPGSWSWLVGSLKLVTAIGIGCLGWRLGLLRPRHAGAVADRSVLTSALFLLPLMLLISPYAWVHGHIFVLPAALVLVLGQSAWPWRVVAALAYASIFLAPVTDSFPLSFHRTVSLFALCALWIPLTSSPNSHVTDSITTK